MSPKILLPRRDGEPLHRPPQYIREFPLRPPEPAQQPPSVHGVVPMAMLPQGSKNDGSASGTPAVQV